MHSMLSLRCYTNSCYSCAACHCSSGNKRTQNFPVCVQSSDPDVRATAARIKQFVMEHAYRDSPDGSQLPEYDQSADLAC